MLKKLNLQLFAEPEDGYDFGSEDIDNDGDFPIEDDIAIDDEAELQELSNIDDSEVTPEPEPTPEPDPEKTYKGEDIAKAVQAERKKWQKKMNELQQQPQQPIQQQQTTGFDEKAFFESNYQAYIEDGWNEQTSKLMAKKDTENEKRYRELENKVSSTGDYATKFKRDIEVEKLKENPLYSDIDLVRDEVEELANKSGLSMEQAYMALHGKSKMYDWKRQHEATILNEQAKKQSTAVNTSTAATQQKKPTLNLSKEEIEAAAIFGMSPKEFAMSKKIDSLDNYQKYIKKQDRKGVLNG